MERRLQVLRTVSARRVLLVHDHPVMYESVRRICRRHQAWLHAAASPSQLLELLSEHSSAFDLVIVKDVGPDWLSLAGTLLACRAFGVPTPFLVIAEPSDIWTKQAVETAGSAVLLDERSSRWLVPVLVDDWLSSGPAFPIEAPQGQLRLQV